jgi:hypothetical protein
MCTTLHRYGRAVEQNDLVAPVEPVGLAMQSSAECKRYRVAVPSSARADTLSCSCLMDEAAKFLEDAGQRQPLPLRLGRMIANCAEALQFPTKISGLPRR